jgi:hypothetical protein
MVVLFTDQNFVPSLPSSDNRCINIVRVENPSLDELLEIAIEILEHITVPDGSVLGFGSASHLSRVGTSLYAN